jgi:hypothetical protein
MFDHENRRTGKFSRYGDALHQPKHEKDERRGHADRRIGRDKSDQGGRHCHHKHGEHEHFLAPESVT